MLQGPHALQARPVLEPEDVVPRVREPTRLLETGDKRAAHKVLDARARLVRQIAVPIGLDRYGGLEPDDEVGDAGREAVGPVVAEDRVVPRVGEWGRIVEGEVTCITPIFRRCPPQAPLDDVVGDGAVLGSHVVRPRDVSDEIGGFALEGA